jgi:hypothetical protein
MVLGRCIRADRGREWPPARDRVRGRRRALHEDENLVEIVSAREDGCAFRVDRSEHELSVRVP